MYKNEQIKLTFRDLMESYGYDAMGNPKKLTAYVNTKLPEWSQNRQLYQINKQLKEKANEYGVLVDKLAEQYKTYTDTTGKFKSDDKSVEEAKKYGADYADLLLQEFSIDIVVFSADLFQKLPNAYLFNLIDLGFLKLDQSKE